MGEITWWPNYCGNNTLYDAFWSDELTVNTSNPDFTQCFQDTALTWGPYGLLWVVSILYMPYLCGRPSRHQWGYIGKFNLFKLVTTLLLAAAAFIELCYVISLRFDGVPETSPKPVHYVTPAIKIVTFILVAVYTHLTFRKGVHSSAVLFVFWLLMLITGIFSFRSKILQVNREVLNLHDAADLFTFVTFYVHFALVLVQFFCTLFSDKAALYPEISQEMTQDGDVDESTPLLGSSSPSRTQPAVEEEPKLCPKITATFLSVLLFWWFTPTIVNGYKRTLSYDDIWSIRHVDSCSCIVPTFQKHWDKELKKRSSSGPKDAKGEGTPSLKKALARTFGPFFMSAGLLLLVYDFIVFINPQILQALIAFVETGDPFSWRGYVYAIGMFCASCLTVVCIHHYFNLIYTTGMRVRTGLTAALYRKALKLSSVARKTATVGEIVNLMSVDTQKLQDAPLSLHFLWSSPLIVSFGMFFLWQQLGPASMAGLVFLLLVLPINSVILAKKIRSLQREQMKLKDSRLKLMNQVLSGIKVLKLYAWEPYFTQKILQIRDDELVVLKKASLLGAATYILWFSSPFLVALSCFAAYVLSSPEHILDAQKAFVSMSLIVVLGFPLTILPSAIMSLVQAIVSTNRIENFLLEEEVDPDNVIQDPMMEHAITIEDGRFSWGEEGRMTLQDINVKVDDGQLIAVVGQVGCGKSSLLSAILGGMRKHQGTVKVKGDVAYVAQQAWIQNMTLRDNILFSKTFDKENYDKIIRACALGPDLDILPGGDQTEIGERGINLSGGQKQRVNLARSVYQNKDIYLFDDPLSAVDAHVGKHIFEQVMGPDGMLRSKTRILVTHGIKYLPKVDKIIVVKDGKISEMGPYEELLSHNGAFAEFIRTYLKETEDSSSEEEHDTETIEQLRQLQKQISTLSGGDDITSDGTDKSNLINKKKSRKTSLKKKGILEKSIEQELIKDLKEKSKKTNLIEEELTEMGAIKLSVIKAYVGAASAGYVCFAFLSLGLFIAAQCSTNIWLSVWSNDKPVNGTQDKELTDLRLGVYGGLAGAQALSVLGLAASIALGAISASRQLHFELLHNILKCPMSFFDTTPLGRIVNRFSKDVDVIDVNIPMFTQNLMTTLAPLLSTFIMIIYSVPIFGVAIVPIAIIFVTLQRVYVACARQIKRIDAVKRSPIYAFFSETLTGVGTIRAYGEQDRFIKHSDQLLDDSQRVWFEVFTSNRWVGIWSELIGDVIILITALLLVVQRDQIDPGLVGLSLSFALQVNINLVMTVRSSCELETYIVAAERIKEYSEIATEADWLVPDKRPPRSWPGDGLVEFKNYQTRYRPGLELVLKGITCSVKPMEKIGIIGRTGAGKSSMTLALFRLIEASGGSIEIDGYDISVMGLHDLRTKLTIIPQDPVLFSGSLRFNLDPSEYFTDDEIWTALQQAHLKDFILTLPETLEYECGEDGENLSVGQRQLLCLARALLKKSKILVLDEATAAVDLETDDLIQTTIRSEFKDCTVLTIAHRLNTIMDYDRVMVMSEGEIKEFDTPTALGKDTTSLFHSMAKDAGLL